MKKAVVILALLVSGCAAITQRTYAMYRHPVTGEVGSCEQPSVAAATTIQASAENPRKYRACRADLEARGYVLQGIEKRSQP